MEAAITAPNAGTVARIAVSNTGSVEGGDLVVVVVTPLESDSPAEYLRHA
jgi:pyruvate carboxylase